MLFSAKERICEIVCVTPASRTGVISHNYSSSPSPVPHTAATVTFVLPAWPYSKYLEVCYPWRDASFLDQRETTSAAPVD